MSRAVTLGGIVISLLLVAVGSSAAGGTSVVRCNLRWRLVPSPRFSYAGLGRIDAVSRGDVWIERGLARGGNPGPVLFEHWDGRRWRVGRLTIQASGGPLSLSASSKQNVWIVGSLSNFDPLLLHYDGQRWVQVSAPSMPNEVDLLYDVAALSPSNGWAVGQKAIRGVGDAGALVLHWDGAGWTSVTPPPGLANLTGLAVVAPDDIWAVAPAQEGSGDLKVAIAHWDGMNWQQVDTGVRAIDLTRAAPDNSGGFWAVGSTSGTARRGVIAHWDGHVLRRVLTAPFRPGTDNFWDVTTSGHQAWAVGYKDIEHWDGQRWIHTRFKGGVTFSGVGALSPRNVWAAGASRRGPVIYHYACR